VFKFFFVLLYLLSFPETHVVLFLVRDFASEGLLIAALRMPLG
jgi:hypothetical protein